MDAGDKTDGGGSGELVTLDKIKAPAVPEAPADSDAEAALFERSRRVLELQRGQQELRHRDSYANRTFWLVVSWFGLVVAVTVMQGFKLGGFILTDVAFGSLIGGTTSVLGVLLVILRHLFPGGGKNA
jgi:hypothetical protein